MICFKKNSSHSLPYIKAQLFSMSAKESRAHNWRHSNTCSPHMATHENSLVCGDRPRTRHRTVYESFFTSFLQAFKHVTKEELDTRSFWSRSHCHYLLSSVPHTFVSLSAYSLTVLSHPSDVSKSTEEMRRSVADARRQCRSWWNKGMKHQGEEVEAGKTCKRYLAEEVW